MARSSYTVKGCMSLTIQKRTLFVQAFPMVKSSGSIDKHPNHQPFLGSHPPPL